jgi:hypothetical protein
MEGSFLIVLFMQYRMVVEELIHRLPVNEKRLTMALRDCTCRLPLCCRRSSLTEYHSIIEEAGYALYGLLSVPMRIERGHSIGFL